MTTQEKKHSTTYRKHTYENAYETHIGKHIGKTNWKNMGKLQKINKEQIQEKHIGKQHMKTRMKKHRGTIQEKKMEITEDNTQENTCKRTTQ